MSTTIALYGGTFDPMHLGHTQVLHAAQVGCGIEHAWVLPAADPPLRAPPGASAAHRLAMARLACAELAGVRVDDRELRRSGPSYTIDTLVEVRAQIGVRAPLLWLIGRDALTRIDRWHRYDELLQFAHFLVLDRPGFDTAESSNAQVAQWVRQHRCDHLQQLHTAPAGRVFFFAGPRVDISATAVRMACARPEGAAHLLAPNVWSYIRQHQLYGVASAAAADATSPSGQQPN